jgi:hypothetical protein
MSLDSSKNCEGNYDSGFVGDDINSSSPAADSSSDAENIFSDSRGFFQFSTRV